MTHLPLSHSSGLLFSMQWWNPCFQQHQSDRAAVLSVARELQGTNSQPALLFHTPQAARQEIQLCTHSSSAGLGLCSSHGKSRFKEGLDWVAGSTNTSHPFRLWKAVKSAGKSELISSIKTWLYLFQCTLQYIKAQTSKPQGSSLLNHYG